MQGTGTGLADTAAMALSGFCVAVPVPALVHATRRAAVWRALTLPAPAALTLFAVLHAAVVLGAALRPPGPVARWALEAALQAGAALFWAPVLAEGPRHRLGEAGRCAYLYLGAPVLDLPAVFLVATGDTAGGLAMIVAMLPIGLLALALTWRWVTAEEGAALAAEAAGAGGAGAGGAGGAGGGVTPVPRTAPGSPAGP
jgi:hypothetical protein